MAQRLQSEPLAALRARYGEAVRDVYDHACIAAGQQNRPSNQRKHVFDFQDGLRLIVSRDRTFVGRTGVFVSASLMPGTPVYESLRLHRGDAREGFCTVVRERWQQLADSKRMPEFQGWSEAGIPHFVVWDLPESVPLHL
jgi:hypothetical protein